MKLFGEIIGGPPKFDYGHCFRDVLRVTAERLNLDLDKNIDDIEPDPKNRVKTYSAEISIAVLHFFHRKNYGETSLVQTKEKFEKVKMLSIQLQEILTGKSFEVIDVDYKGDEQKTYPGREDFIKVLIEASAVVNERNRMERSFIYLDYIFEFLSPIIEIADCALSEILPSQTGKKTKYPFSLSAEEGLIWDLIFFYCEVVESCYYYPWEIAESGMGTPKDPGLFYLFVNDIWKALNIPDEGKGLRIKIRRVFTKMKRVKNETRKI